MMDMDIHMIDMYEIYGIHVKGIKMWNLHIWWIFMGRLLSWDMKKNMGYMLIDPSENDTQD